jgi:hypothetical protein
LTTRRLRNGSAHRQERLAAQPGREHASCQQGPRRLEAIEIDFEHCENDSDALKIVDTVLDAPPMEQILA